MHVCMWAMHHSLIGTCFVGRRIVASVDVTRRISVDAGRTEETRYNARRRQEQDSAISVAGDFGLVRQFWKYGCLCTADPMNDDGPHGLRFGATINGHA